MAWSLKVVEFNADWQHIEISSKFILLENLDD